MNHLLTVMLVTSALIRTTAMGQNQALDLVLPTDNDALFSSGGAAFYQHIDRNFKGVKSTPWEGGQYGFVRDPTDTAGGVVYTRFHEGIDIRPLHRDAVQSHSLPVLDASSRDHPGRNRRTVRDIPAKRQPVSEETGKGRPAAPRIWRRDRH